MKKKVKIISALTAEALDKNINSALLEWDKEDFELFDLKLTSNQNYLVAALVLGKIKKGLR
jgi:hypothetical protein